MVDIPWSFVGQLARSRPFLLCIMMLMGLFLWLHYSAPQGEMAVFSHSEVVYATSRRHMVSSVNNVSSGLMVDSIPPVTSKDKTDKTLADKVSADKTSADKTSAPAVQADDNMSRVFVTSAEGSKCRKKFDVSFLKVHKAGSTTVMNIFLRFAIAHDLNIVLPSKAEGFGFNYLGYGKTVSRDRIVPLPGNETYNILCNHVVYNKEAFQSILPADTVYVGILREPVSHFTSAATYYGFYNGLKQMMGDTPSAVSDYLRQPSSYRIATYFVKNRMSFDLGVPTTEFENPDFVDGYIRELDHDYKLMMIMEHFPESLVLMKRTLCWDTKDILYVPLNAMKKKPDFHLDEEDLQRLKKWNNADFKMYDHFKAKFLATLEKHGQDLKDEVTSFSEIQVAVKEFCATVGYSAVDASVEIPGTKWGDSFMVTAIDCRLMKENELSMMKRLISGAWQKYQDAKNS